MRNVRILTLLVAALAFESQAHAISSFSPSDLSSMTSTGVNSLIQTVAVGGDYRAYMPATPQGILIGIDVGVEVTGLAFPSEFKDALSAATGNSASSLPALLPVPRLSIHKGLPFGIDFGFSFSKLSSGGQDILTTYGGDIQYALLSGVTVPAIAIRASYNSSKVYFLDTKSLDFDLVVSKNFIVIDPYAGAGFQFWSGDLSIPTGFSGGGLPSSVSASSSGKTPRFFGGAQLKLGFLRLTGEASYSTAGVTTYGTKISLGF